MRRTALVWLDQQHQLAEYFRQIAAVDLIDDEHILLLRIVRRRPAEIVKYPVFQQEMPLVVRPEALNEIFVAGALVELHHGQPRPVLDAHQQERQAIGDVGLAGSRRSLQDEIFLAPQQRHHSVERRRFDEQIVERVGAGVLGDSLDLHPDLIEKAVLLLEKI